MELEIQAYTKDRIPDVLDFERRLRKEEEDRDGRSIRPISALSRGALMTGALTIPFLCWHMMTARLSEGLTLPLLQAALTGQKKRILIGSAS